jgi:aspartyl/asparaginyl beta-hydroxylase (cupin superfamily)
MAGFLEAHFETILNELKSILSVDGRFDSMQRNTRNAEPQFGPRDDDWQTAYLARGGEFIQTACEFAPETCALMRLRPEVADCKGSLSGVGFLRLQPGARLKPHFGNSPRLTVHLGLIVPPGDIHMVVGGEVVRWVAGKAIVFDDTFVHSVRHDGLESRYVLLTWMCHPCDPTNGRRPDENTEVPEYCNGPERGVLPPKVF